MLILKTFKKSSLHFSREEVSSCLRLRGKAKFPSPCVLLHPHLLSHCLIILPQGKWSSAGLRRHLCRTLGPLSHQTFLVAAIMLQQRKMDHHSYVGEYFLFLSSRVEIKLSPPSQKCSPELAAKATVIKDLRAARGAMN